MRAALLFVFLLALMGCRESLLTPEESATDQPEETQAPPDDALADVRRGYLKGPAYVAVGSSGTFKAPPGADVFFYEWSQRGDGGFRVFASRERIVSFDAFREGEVMIEYVAYTGEGEPVLRGSLPVDVIE
ncbi:MAG: hypothetical protein AAF624_11160 [Bacteroidota bacterium]